jgi:hypothetical protein
MKFLVARAERTELERGPNAAYPSLAETGGPYAGCADQQIVSTVTIDISRTVDAVPSPVISFPTYYSPGPSSVIGDIMSDIHKQAVLGLLEKTLIAAMFEPNQVQSLVDMHRTLSGSQIEASMAWAGKKLSENFARVVRSEWHQVEDAFDDLPDFLAKYRAHRDKTLDLSAEEEISEEKMKARRYSLARAVWELREFMPATNNREEEMSEEEISAAAYQKALEILDQVIIVNQDGSSDPNFGPLRNWRR